MKTGNRSVFHVVGIATGYQNGRDCSERMTGSPEDDPGTLLPLYASGGTLSKSDSFKRPDLLHDTVQMRPVQVVTGAFDRAHPDRSSESFQPLPVLRIHHRILPG